MAVVYVDSVFVLNTLMDYLILTAAAGLSGRSVGRRRCLLAAAFGGIYAVAVFLPGCALLSNWIWKFVAGVLIAAAAYAGQPHFIRLTLLALAISCGLAGCVLALGMLSGGVPVERGVFYTNVDAKVLLIAASAAYVLFSLVFRAGARNHVNGTRVDVRIQRGDCAVSLIALRDTGNALLNPATGQPILVADARRTGVLFSEDVRRFLRPQTLQNPADILEILNALCPAASFHLIPYSAVGVSGGLLLAFRSDWVEIGGRKYPHLSVALSPTEVGESFDALWGGEEGEQHEKNLVFHPPSAGKGGDFSAKPGSLHRRQRHPSAAAAEGSGGGTAGAAGRSRGAKNPDRT
jgi:stage II sporulation protein GA (sporulation sigma-E factor processing peptidase)